MPKPLLRLGQYLLIAALFAACGGHWLVLQSVAWGGMIVEYSHSSPLVTAVQKTFDGQHPCGLCKAIQKSKGSEEGHAAQVIVSKLELFYAPATVLIHPAREVRWLGALESVFEARAEQPSVPPPRFA